MNIDIIEKRYKFKTANLIKREFFEYREYIKFFNMFFYIFQIPSISKVLIKTQYTFIKNNTMICCEIYPKADTYYCLLHAKSELRKGNE